MLIRTVTGSESFREGSSKFFIFAPSQHSLTLSKEMFLGEAAKLPNKPISNLAFNQFNAGHLPDMGKIFDCQYEVPDGLILKLFGMKTANGQGISTGGARRNANIYIRTRMGAAVQRINFIRVGAEFANQGDMMVEGAFDIIGWQDALRSGVDVDRKYLSSFNEDRRPGVFDVTTIRGEVVTQQVSREERVQDAEGQTKVVRTVEARRAIDLD